jgi:hypothetical protein
MNFIQARDLNCRQLIFLFEDARADVQKIKTMFLQLENWPIIDSVSILLEKPVSKVIRKLHK